MREGDSWRASPPSQPRAKAVCVETRHRQLTLIMQNDRAFAGTAATPNLAHRRHVHGGVSIDPLKAGAERSRQPAEHATRAQLTRDAMDGETSGFGADPQNGIQRNQMN